MLLQLDANLVQEGLKQRQVFSAKLAIKITTRKKLTRTLKRSSVLIVDIWQRIAEVVLAKSAPSAKTDTFGGLRIVKRIYSDKNKLVTHI